MKVLKKYYPKLRNLFWKRYANILQRKCYSGIEDLPILNWWKFHDSGDVSYLLLEKAKVNKLQSYGLSILWERVYDQYIGVFGFGENFLMILEKQKEIALLQVDLITSDDATIYTHIGIAETQLEELQKNNHGEHNFYETKANIERILGVQIDIKKTSVIEFYSYIRMIEKTNTKEAA